MFKMCCNFTLLFNKRLFQKLCFDTVAQVTRVYSEWYSGVSRGVQSHRISSISYLSTSYGALRGIIFLLKQML